MAIKDLLKKKDKISHDAAETSPAPETPPTPEFTFMRTDTNTQEIIQPPSFAGDNDPIPAPSAHLTTPPKRSLGRFRKSSNASTTSRSSEKESSAPSRKLSQRLHLSRASSASSVHIPSDLPTIPDPYSENGDHQEKEAQWEERATRLAKENSSTPVHTGGDMSPPVEDVSRMKITDADGSASRPSSRPRSVSDAAGDENIQEAISYASRTILVLDRNRLLKV